MSKVESASSHRPPCRECGAYEGHYMMCSENPLQSEQTERTHHEKHDSSSSSAGGSDSVADHPAAAAELEADKRRMDLLESKVFTNREGEHEIHLDFTVGSLREACDMILSPSVIIKSHQRQ